MNEVSDWMKSFKKASIYEFVDDYDLLKESLIIMVL